MRGTAIILPEDALINIRPVILCGGKGKRLWPLSRPSKPKPFIKVFSKYSLLQKTIQRVSCCLAPVIISEARHQNLVEQHLAEINCTPHKIIYEPEGRNTAPAIIAAAEILKQESTPLLFLPSDHEVLDVKNFLSSIKDAAKNYDESGLVLFGIKPRATSTRYGYIRMNEQGNVQKFTEKPNYDTARRYMQDQSYYWNSGMILSQASILLENAKFCAPELFNVVQKSVQNANLSKNKRIFLEKSSFVKAPSISFDYAVLESCEKLKGKVLSIQWGDLGTWPSIIQKLMGRI